MRWTGLGATWRRAAAAVAGRAGLAAGSAQANWYESPFVKGRLVQVDVYDRADGSALPVYAKDGRNYIVGTPGHEYAVRIRNCTGARVLVVTSVDGVNVISGDTAAPSQSGYVLEPWGYGRDHRLAQEPRAHGGVLLHRPGRLVCGAHRPAAERRRDRRRRVPGEAATRRCTTTGSAAAPVPRPKHRPTRTRRPIPSPLTARKEARADAAAPVASRGNARARRSRRAATPRSKDSPEAVRRSLGKLGTGHGRNEDSRVTTVALRARHANRPRKRWRSSTTAARTWSRWACCRRPYYRAARPARSVPGRRCASRPIRGELLLARGDDPVARIRNCAGVGNRRAPLLHTWRAMFAPRDDPLRFRCRGLRRGADARLRRGPRRGVRHAVCAAQGRRLPLPAAPLRQRRHRRRTVPGRLDECDPRARSLRAHGEVHDMALHARPQPARRSLARERPGEVRVDRRRRRRGHARDRWRRCPRRAATSPKCASTHGNCANNCMRRWRRCRPCSATRSCCSTRADCRSPKSRQLTGVGVETVKSRLRYAVAKLRGELATLGASLREECTMTHDPDNPERDPALDAAWREHSTEMPPARAGCRDPRRRASRGRQRSAACRCAG